MRTGLISIMLLALLSGWISGILRAVESPVFDASAEVDAWACRRTISNGMRSVRVETRRYTWAVDTYLSQNWLPWDTQVATWFDDVGSIALYAPLTTTGNPCFIEKGLEEITEAFAAVTNSVPAVLLGGVPTWQAWTWERISSGGLRTFGTVVGTSVCREMNVSNSFEPRLWSLQRYGEEGRQPPWTDVGTWFAARGRERFGFMVTLVPEGMSAAYRAVMVAKAQTEADRDAANPAMAWPLRVTKMDIAANTVTLEYYNPYHYEIGLFSCKTYAQTQWDFFGSVNSTDSYARVVVPLPEDSSQAPRFFKLGDLESDEDSDGIPDTLETNVYGTDPNLPDTAGSGLSDWEKIFVYDLNPLVVDTDGDTFSDGVEVFRGTNPRVADINDPPLGIVDIDTDDLPDGWETETGLNPESAEGDDGTTGDPDDDGLSNVAEHLLGTHPKNADTDGDGLPDGWETRNGLNPLSAEGNDGSEGDPDDDGLSNARELALGTDPSNPDSDGDDLSDGWEVQYGLNPLSSEGNDGAEGDPDDDTLSNGEEWREHTAPDNPDTDGDGLTDGRECEIGSNPNATDTDGDGISDYDEVGGFQRRASIWFPISGGVNLLAGVTTMQDTGMFESPLPFVLQIGKMNCTRLRVDVNGRVILMDADNANVPSSENSERPLGNSGISTRCPVLAGYWDDLSAFPAAGSAILTAEMMVGSERLFIVEFRNFYRYNRQALPERKLSFQIAVSQTRPRNIYLNYRDLGAEVTGDSATIGLLLPLTKQVYQYTYRTAGSVWSGLSLVGHIATDTDPTRTDSDGDGLGDNEEGEATGTSPTSADSDSDGLNDREEIRLGTDPDNPDSDGDGMPDGWEVRHGLNPLVNDANGDLDHDGRTNLREYNNGTDPDNVDTDGDGLSDGEESGISVSPLNPDSDGDGLLDGQEVLLGTSNNSKDSDNDGLDDGWEVRYELNPLSTPENKETWGDPDDDGLPNLSEFRNGTNPKAADTDGDGLTDAEEIGCIRSDLPVPNGLGLNMANVTAQFSNADTACIDVVLPHPVTLQGVLFTHATLDVNGMVYLRTADDTANIGSSSGNSDLGDPNSISRRVHTVVLAPFWADLKLLSEQGSTVRVGTLVQGTQYCNVIEYTDMAFAQKEFATNRISFRLVIPGGTRDSGTFAYVYYPSATGAGTGEDASVGFQAYGGKMRHSLGWRRSGMVQSGMGLTFILGCGTRPTLADSDRDGLSDREELSPFTQSPPAASVTNPLLSDTDGDGLNDGWEIAFGYDPLTADDAGADPDSDGLTDLEESMYGTNPESPDSDGDGTPDGPEIRQNSDPDDPSDFGVAGSRVPVQFYFGDPSDSHSEKYFLTIEPDLDAEDAPLLFTPKTFHWVNVNYGECETRTAMLHPDVTYRCILRHADTRPEEGAPDLDYAWQISASSGIGCIIKDPDEVLGDDFSDVTFPDAGRICRVRVLGQILSFDVNRDGKIDEADGKKVAQGAIFRHWVNDDNDCGDTSDISMSKDLVADPPDTPRGESAFLADCNETRFGSEVNGRTDLEDFAPIRVDFGKLAAWYPQSEGYRYRLRQSENAVSFVYTKLETATVGTWFREDFAFCGAGLDESSHGASVMLMRAGVLDLEETAFLTESLQGGASGVLMVEGRQVSAAAIGVEVLDSEGKVCFSAELPTRIDNVEAMYRTVNLRGETAHFDTSATASRPDAESDGTLFFFVHGYNVNATSARAWNAEMFKRLWQAGAHVMYVGVLWRGDETQLTWWDVGVEISPDYYVNVGNALAAAPRFAAAVETVKAALSSGTPVQKTVVAAHSLGNMLASSAIAHHGLEADRYLMLNAAVAMEAYASEAITAVSARNMCHPKWRIYEARLRASRWHQLFTGIENDKRAALTWRGFFGNIPNAVNFYSEGEDVLANAPMATGSENNIPSLFESSHAWFNQEVRKGNWPKVLPGNNEAGWRFVDDEYRTLVGYVTPPGGGAPQPEYQRWTPEEMEAVPDSQLRYNPFFSPFDDPEVVTDGGSDFLRQNTNTFHRILADGIPAESYAAGANDAEEIDLFSQQMQCRSSTWWPDERKSDRNKRVKWLHSDLKNVAFPFVSHVFADIVDKVKGVK